jgi:hypothetical protein
VFERPHHAMNRAMVSSDFFCSWPGLIRQGETIPPQGKGKGRVRPHRPVVAVSGGRFLHLSASKEHLGKVSGLSMDFFNSIKHRARNRQ